MIAFLQSPSLLLLCASLFLSLAVIAAAGP
jgi:hypothetical protein